MKQGKSTVLFDTGARGDILLNNIEKLDINSGIINKIIISHEHWDHTAGLKMLTCLFRDAELYRLKKHTPSEKMHLISIHKTQKIIQGVHTTGKLKGSVDEQALVIKGKEGRYVLVGCSHSGV